MMRLAFAALLAIQWFGGGERNTREGAEHLENGRLEEALRAFSRAEGAWPEAPENDLNIAGVHYRMAEDSAAAGEGEAAGEGPLWEAARGYEAALAGGTAGAVRRDGFFNLANTLYRGGAYREAAAAYGEAIALDPDDLEARQNLERALRRAEEAEEERERQEQEGGEQQEQPENGEQPQDWAERGEPPAGGDPQEESPENGAGENPEPPERRENTPPEETSPDESPPEPASGADPRSGDEPGEVPEISPEQAERMLAALAEVERAFQQDRLEQRRARALRRGRH